MGKMTLRPPSGVGAVLRVTWVIPLAGVGVGGPNAVVLKGCAAGNAGGGALKPGRFIGCGGGTIWSSCRRTCRGGMSYRRRAWCNLLRVSPRLGLSDVGLLSLLASPLSREARVQPDGGSDVCPIERFAPAGLTSSGKCLLRRSIERPGGLGSSWLQRNLFARKHQSCLNQLRGLTRKSIQP